MDTDEQAFQRRGAVNAKGRRDFNHETHKTHENQYEDENSPMIVSRFEPLQSQDAQVIDNLDDDLEVHGADGR
jgi:hypothetical protein